MTRREQDELLKAIKDLRDEVERLRNRPQYPYPVAHQCCHCNCFYHYHPIYPTYPTITIPTPVFGQIDFTNITGSTGFTTSSGTTNTLIFDGDSNIGGDNASFT